MRRSAGQHVGAGYVPAGAFVNVYLGLGDNEQALVWMERAYKEQSNILQFVKVHSFFVPLAAIRVLRTWCDAWGLARHDWIQL